MFLECRVNAIEVRVANTPSAVRDPFRVTTGVRLWILCGMDARSESLTLYRYVFIETKKNRIVGKIEPDLVSRGHRL